MLKPFPREIFLGEAGNIILTIIWFVGITNAFNFFDGMDGLATGLAIQIGVFISIVAFSTNQEELGWISVAIVGASFGFLPHNFKMKKPAEIFLGDSGSMVLGFLLAGLAVRAEWAVGHPLLTLSPPLLVFGVLIYDMIHTTVSRIARGDVRNFKQWLEYTGKDHLHHRFEALLHSKRFAVILVLTLNLCLALAALIIRYVNLTRALILLLQCLVILILVTILERAGNLRERRTGSSKSD
jgi:UDP-GlcNAc:undecaprenyl-phosphate GlcNAc-1-phosphate transferase